MRFELKLAALGASIARAFVNASIKIALFRDRRDVKVYKAKTRHADDLNKLAIKLENEAEELREEANRTYNQRESATRRVLNRLRNLDDNLPYSDEI